MKEIYKLILILICFFILLNYNKIKNLYEIKNIFSGGSGLLKNVNNKTEYFKIKSTDTTKIISDPITLQSKIINDDNKNEDIPHNSIWEIRTNGTNYIIKNTENQQTIAYNIKKTTEKIDTNYKEFNYDNKGYILQLVRNKNVFNICFHDSSVNKLGKMYLVKDDKSKLLIAKSEEELLKIDPKLATAEFMLEPYRLNLFNETNEIITHYENFVNYFNYENFKLSFSLDFKYISIPSIFKQDKINKFTYITERYNIYPTNWIAGPNSQKDENGFGQFKGDKEIDVRYRDLYNNKDTKQLIISDNNLIISKLKSNITENNNNLATWIIKFNNDEEGTYSITNNVTKKSILNNIIENSKKFFENSSNYIGSLNYSIDITTEQEEKIYFEEIEDKKNHYNLSFFATVTTDKAEPVKMYISTSNWNGMLVARKAGGNTFSDRDKKPNAFVIETNELDERTPEIIQKTQQSLGLTDNDLNNIIPNTVDLNKTLQNKYLPLKYHYLRDILMCNLYKMYYEKIEFYNKSSITKNIEKKIEYLSTKKELENNKLTFKKLEQIIENSNNIEKTIKDIQYIFNIKTYNTKYYDNNPIGEILTIGNNMYNTHNFIIKIIKKNSKYCLVLGFIDYINNIEIPLDKIKNVSNKFPALTHFILEYKKPYINILVNYNKKNSSTKEIEEIKGYLDIYGNITSITNISNNQQIETLKKNNSNINFEIYFPPYLNPWCSVGTNDNINVITKEVKYSDEGFLNEKYTSNKTLKNINYEIKNNNNRIQNLNSLKEKYINVSGNNNNFNFTKNNTLVFNIKLKLEVKKQPADNDILKYGVESYVYSHHIIGERKNGILGACNNAASTCTSVGTVHYIDLYRLYSNYTTNYPYIATYKLVPKIDKKINVEYGDEFWISMKDSGNFFKNQIINCWNDRVLVSYYDRNNSADPYSKNISNWSLLKIVSPYGNTGPVLKKDKFLLVFKDSGRYLTCTQNTDNPGSCGGQVENGVFANKTLYLESQLWSLIETSVPIKNNLNEALIDNSYFNKQPFDNIELFDIKNSNETLKISINDNKLTITEHDIKYKIDDSTYNTNLIHNNLVNTICKKKMHFSNLTDIRFDFIPIHNQYNLTIHNGNTFIDCIGNIDLLELSRNSKINVNDTIELKYKIISNQIINYILPDGSSNKNSTEVNWFASTKSYNNRADAIKYCKMKNTELLNSRAHTKGSYLGADAWYRTDFGYSYAVGEKTGIANYPEVGPAVCEKKSADKWIIGNPKKWVRGENNRYDNQCRSEYVWPSSYYTLLEGCKNRAEEKGTKYMVRYSADGIDRGVSHYEKLNTYCYPVKNCDQPRHLSTLQWGESYAYQMYVNIREASLMATNYFGTKIKNNFYRSNRIDNLTLRISSETQEEEKKLNPQTVLWSESYNNQRSNFWWKSGYYPEIINKVKNKFLQGKNQTVIYEFNQPINISFLKVNTDLVGHRFFHDGHEFDYWSEKEGKYISLKTNIEKSRLKSGTKVYLKSVYNNKYLSADIQEAHAFKWINDKVEYHKPWIFEFDDMKVHKGMEVYIKSTHTQTYLHSNHWTGGGVSQGGKHQGGWTHWYLHWDNELIDGAKIRLRSRNWHDYTFSSKLHSDKWYNLEYYEKNDPGWIIEFSNTFEKLGVGHTGALEKYAYKFRFKNKYPAKIYNILMYGSLLRTYPSFNVKNIGIGLIKTKNNKPEKEVFVNYIKDKYGTWIKVGIFKANACETIRDMMYTTHNLSILTDQNIDSTFSADFGNMRSPEVRVLGATDYQNWEETRTIDFVYKVPKVGDGYKQWKYFFQPRTRGDVGYPYNHGFDVAGAYDGRGRWINDKFSFVHVTTYGTYNYSSGAFLGPANFRLYTPSGGGWANGGLYVNGNPEVSHIPDKHYGGGTTSGFGISQTLSYTTYYQGQYFFDINYNAEEIPLYTKYYSSNKQHSLNHYDPSYMQYEQQKVTFSSAVWVLLKVNEEDLKIVDPDPEIIKKDLTKQINDLKKTNIKLQNQINEEKKLKEKNTNKLDENNIKDNVDTNLNTLYEKSNEYTDLKIAIDQFNNENNPLIDEIEIEFQKIVKITGQKGYVYSKYFDKIYTHKGNNINFNSAIENFSYEELMNDINSMKNDINRFRNNQIKWNIKDIIYAASIDGYVGVYNHILKSFKQRYDANRQWKVSGTDAGINFFTIPKTVDWNTGTIQEFKNKFNKWNAHVNKIKNNPPGIPVNNRTAFKYIHGKGSSWAYTFRDQIDWLKTSGTLTESNMKGRYLTYSSVLQLVKKSLAKKPPTYNGFLLAARDGSLIAYNSGKPSWAQKSQSPATHRFQAVWYFPFNYKQYNELKRRIDWGYRKINSGLNLMTTVLNNNKPRFEEFNNKVEEIENKIIEYRNVVIEKVKKDLEKEIENNDTNIQNFTAEINKNKKLIENINDKIKEIN